MKNGQKIILCVGIFFAYIIMFAGTAAADYNPLIISKTDGCDQIEQGESLLYEISFENPNGQEVSDVIITDTLPAGVTFVDATADGKCSDGVVTWNIGTMSASEYDTVSVTVQVDSNTTGNLVNTAEIECNESEQISICEDETEVVIVYLPLIISKTDGYDQIEQGESLTYEITFENPNEQEVNGVTITDALPKGVTFVDATADGKCSDGVVTWNKGSMAAFECDAVSVTVQVDSNTIGNLVNTAEIECSEIGQISRCEDETEAIAMDYIMEAIATDYVAEPLSVAYIPLEISKTDGHDNVTQGEYLIYEITFENPNEHEVNGVIITDTLPKGVTFVDADEGEYSDGIVTWDIGTMSASDSGSVFVTVVVDSDPNRELVNFAEIKCNEIRKISSCKDKTKVLPGIPEFPTIAIPMAAILGLAFFFQRRKD
ncbi:PEF-CTERM sorting domain-containing protein [Methanolobus vulcani]|uniref:DUF11 domain-containing protein n=1 Tax=Methanolobus vulcani TaxID=38026 RepID=A0A7Z8P1V0_9EURY|nr:PEF-CTERM sorting domain-containing protein [Methanolobus vulcani]TQD24885.1 DUF11 domain-containing protein [Methanolobus vulcani]